MCAQTAGAYCGFFFSFFFFFVIQLSSGAEVMSGGLGCRSGIFPLPVRHPLPPPPFLHHHQPPLPPPSEEKSHDLRGERQSEKAAARARSL